MNQTCTPAKIRAMRRLAYPLALAALIALAFSGDAYARKKLDLEDWLARPGVKAVALVFVAPWSKTSAEEAPKWAALAKKHHAAGLRVIAVGMQDPERGCASPSFGDDVVCDESGRIAKAWTNGLPGAFVFDWRGVSIGPRTPGDYAALAARIETWIRAKRAAEIAVVSGPETPSTLPEMIASDLERRGKFDTVTTRATPPERKAPCPSGQADLSNKLQIRAELTTDGEKLLVLEASAASASCSLATASEPWSDSEASTTITDAADKLLLALSTKAGPDQKQANADQTAASPLEEFDEEPEKEEPETPSTSERREARALLLASEAPPDHPPLAPPLLKAVEEEYIDPARVRPHRMLRGAIRALSELMPALTVKPARKGDLRVSLGNSAVVVGAGDIVDLAELAGEIKDVVDMVAKEQAATQPATATPRAGLEAVLLDGALATLDQTSRIVSPSEQEARKGELVGRTGGIGVELTMKDDVLRIYAPIDGGPSAKAGLRPGDMITQIDGVPTSRMTFDDALQRLRGDIGSKVAVTVTREGWKKPATYVLVRGTIEPKIIEGRRLPGDIALLRLRKLSPGSVEDLVPTFERLTPRRGRLRGLILDLRGTTGTLDAAITAADAFLPSGDLATVATRKTRDVKIATASARDISDTPVAVIIDRDTRGPGELLAAALEGSNRALLLGERTRGAASAATTFELPAGFGADIRTRQTLTVGGKKIDEVGLAPDVVVLAWGSTERSFEGSVVVPAPKGPQSADYVIELARKLLDKAGSSKRTEMLRDMRATLDKEKK